MQPDTKTKALTAAGVVVTAVMFFVVWFHYQIMPRFESLLAVGITVVIIAIGFALLLRSH